MPAEFVAAQDNIYSLEGIINNKDNKEKVNSLLSLCVKYYKQNEPDSAFICARNALSVSEKINYQAGIADSYYKLSTIHNQLNNTDSSLYYVKKALSIAVVQSDSMIIAKANYRIGNLIKETGIPFAAINHFRIAYRIYWAKNLVPMVAIVCNGIGNYYQKISQYDSAAVYFYKFLDHASENTPPIQIAMVHSNLGMINQDLKEYDIALEYYNKAYPVIMNSSNAFEKGAILNKLGTREVALENYHQAEIYFHKADSIYRKIDYKLGISHCWINMALLYWEQHQYAKSLANYNSALSYYRSIDYADGMIVAWDGIAAAYQAMQDYKMALIYTDSCLSLAKQSQNLLRQEEALIRLSSIYTLMKEWEKVTNTVLLTNEIADSIYALKKVTNVQELMLRYERDKDQLRILDLQNKSLQRTKQRNVFLIIGVGLLIFAVYIYIFFRYRARKNQIIAEQRIQQLEEEKKLMAARFLVEGQENERKRIASAIHDSLGVLLSTSKMHITAIKDDNPENRALIDKATRFLDEANTEMRKISHNMMPGALSKLGLCEALEDLFETLDETEGIDARMEVLGPKERLPENQEIMIYRVVQEMVNNTLKHSKADRIDLTLVIHPDELDLSYSDNGKGFDVEEVKAKKSMGIQSIRSRVKFLDGIIKIDSSPGKGVVYRISVPVDANKGLTSV